MEGIATGAGRTPATVTRTATAAEASQYLAFLLGGETFAVRILVIKEIIEHRALTQVPMMPPWIAGVINLRGAAVPVIDLATRFGRPPTQVTKRTCIVIVETTLDGKQQSVGLVVDGVKAVLEIDPQDIEPVPPFGVKISGEFLSGVGKVDGRFVILLNVERVVAVEDVAAAAVASG
jgi:purine-binding chemotaxis protein CheW